MIKIVNEADCCGCEACVQRCPKQCIAMVMDDELFYYPKLDLSKCIDCGLCESVCPMLHVDPPKAPLKVCAAKNLNLNDRMGSSSGGMFIAIARCIINDGGVVFGAVYDKKWNVMFTSSDTIEGVYPMMGSKYVQARVGKAFEDVERYVKSGRKVLFSGTPCQIFALKRFLRKDYPNLVSVDFLCAGVPSPGVWSKYLSEVVTKSASLEAETGKNTVLSSFLNSISIIGDIEFRNKTQHGWEKYSFVVRKNSAFQGGKNSVLLSDIHYDNGYMQGFLSGIFKRRSCYSCKFVYGNSYSDLTIADFWGIRRAIPEFADDKGVSLVMVNSNSGKAIFDSLPIEYRMTSLAVAKALNGGFAEKRKIHPKRQMFYSYLHENASYSEALTVAMHLSLFEKTFKLMRRATRKLWRLFVPNTYM